MSEVRIPANASAASLVGSLTIFALTDVLDLLGRTNRRGELEVLGYEFDVHLWVDDGELLELEAPADKPVASAGGRLGGVGGVAGVDEPGHRSELFGAACAQEGWFYFTDSAPLPPQARRRSLDMVLADLRPAVAEWRELVAELPFTARLRMADSTPASEVQIKAAEWQLLSKVGNQPGQSIRQLVDSADEDPLQLLRILRGMVDGGLVEADNAEVTAAGGEGQASIAAPVTTVAPTAAPLEAVGAGVGAVAALVPGSQPPAAPPAGWAPAPTITEMPGDAGYVGQGQPIDPGGAEFLPPPPPPQMHIGGQMAPTFTPDGAVAPDPSAGWDYSAMVEAPTVMMTTGPQVHQGMAAPGADGVVANPFTEPPVARDQ